LEKALHLLGPNGENWTQGIFNSPKECAVSCVARVVPKDNTEDTTLRWAAWDFLYPAMGINMPNGCISEWNDAPGQTFPEIEAAFLKAIELAKADEASA